MKTARRVFRWPTLLKSVLTTVVVLASTGVGEPAVVGAQALGAFTVNPDSGPSGTTIQMASVTPCPAPAPGAEVVVRLVQFPSFNDVVLLREARFPLRADGGWSGTVPAEFEESGVVEIDATCSGSGSAYQTEQFRQTPSGRGYWLATATEIGVPCFCPPPAPPTNIASFGDARYFGSPAEVSPAIPLVGVAATPVEGLGYWVVAADGGVFTFGDARFFGSAGGEPLNKPIVGMAPTPTGGGYWLVASDGGVFTFGDAGFFGSAGGAPLNRPIVGMSSTPTGGGYWLVASDGGVFTFGDAGFFGSAGGAPLNEPIVGMAATATGGGYWLAARDGGIFTYGDAPFLFSCSGCLPPRPGTGFVGISATPATRAG